ncbi:MAG: DNA polymerase III subunit chi [Cardiobacteriaceae bacterium]|nr:DNA polymerase III subunit chi [Cardiobacteriaceae bacterium]
MTQISKPLIRFYVLPADSGLENRLDLTCKLAEKAQEEDLKTLVLCADDNMAAQLDERLWSYRAESFLTHCRTNDPLAEEASVLLAIVPERAVSVDVLINLSLENTPDIPRGCKRIMEIVSPQVDVLQSTRSRFAAYRECGFEPQTHKIAK